MRNGYSEIIFLVQFYRTLSLHALFLFCCSCRGNQWPQLNTSWILFKQGFDECVAAGGREIVMSVETCEASNSQGCQQWIPALANLWRTTSDIQANWGSVLYNLDNNNPLAHIAGPGHWNGAFPTWSAYKNFVLDTWVCRSTSTIHA